MSAWSAVAIRSFSERKEVDVETRSPEGKRHQVIIWIVVVDGVPYVRSYLGPRGRWWKELMERKEGAILVGKVRYPVKATLVTDAATNDRVSRALGTKYATSKASLAGMLRPEVIPTTARLDPA